MLSCSNRAFVNANERRSLCSERKCQRHRGTQRVFVTDFIFLHAALYLSLSLALSLSLFAVSVSVALLLCGHWLPQREMGLYWSRAEMTVPSPAFMNSTDTKPPTKAHSNLTASFVNNLKQKIINTN